MGSLFGSPSPPPPPPPPPPPAPMPVEDDPAIQAARRKKQAAVQARSGRESTILSEAGMTDKLGG